MDAEVPFYGSAPELVRPNPSGTRIKTTKESDIYAFSLLAWEVCYLPLTPVQTFTELPTHSFSLGTFPSRVFTGPRRFTCWQLGSDRLDLTTPSYQIKFGLSLNNVGTITHWTALPSKPFLRSFRGKSLETPLEKAEKLERYRCPGGIVLSQGTPSGPVRA